MKEDENPSPPTEKPGLLIRVFLIVLPLGLAFMVPMSLWIYYQKKYRPAPAASEFAAMLRRDLNAEDFARYARILSQDIGERSLAKPDNLNAAAAFIESTMGYDNMGYAVQRQAFEAKGKSLVNLVAELPGKSKRDEIVLVVASYDEPDAAGVSALMCVAHAFAGSTHARTIRFAATLVEANGLAALRQDANGETKALHHVIHVGSASRSKPAEEDQAMIQFFSMQKGNAPGPQLEQLQALQKLIEQTANAP